jgi:hypothetical protein
MSFGENMRDAHKVDKLPSVVPLAGRGLARLIPTTRTIIGYGTAQATTTTITTTTIMCVVFADARTSLCGRAKNIKYI